MRGEVVTARMRARKVTAMDKEFLAQVEEATRLVHQRKLRALGECGLTHRLANLMSKRLGWQKRPSAVYVGDTLHKLLTETIDDMRPPGIENEDESPWRHYIFLHCYAVLGWSVEKIWTTQRLHLGRAATFEIRQPAIESLAIGLWYREEDAAALSARHNLPRPCYSHFVVRVDHEGRDCVEWIIEQLSTARAWVVAIDGHAGVGKTTVALETARRCLERGLFEAIIWTSAQHQAFYPPDMVVKFAEYVTSLHSILDLVGKTLEKRDIKEASSLEDKLRAVRDVLAVTNCLLIIDNLESLSQNAQDDIFGFLLHDLPQPSRALVVGREGGYPGQITVTIPGMGVDEALVFIHREAESRGVRPPSEAEARRIYEATQGVPLAMQQAIGLIQSLGYGADKAAAFGRLHEQMLDFMYEEAYKKLGDEDRRVLHVMPIFAEPASPEAIGAASSSSSSHLTVGLGRLYRAFLVQKVGYDRYDTLPLTREFLQSMEQRGDLLVPDVPLSEFVANAHRDLVQYYVDALAAMNLAERLAFLRYEKGNVLRLMEWCHALQDSQLLVDVVAVMGWPLAVLGYWKVRMIWAQRAIEASRDIGRSDLEAWFQVHDLAWSYVRTGQLEDGQRIIQEALRLAQQHGYRRVEALALRNLGRLAGERGDTGIGVEYLEKSLALWREEDDAEWLSRTVEALGLLRCQQEDWTGARGCLEEALELHREIGYLDGEIGTLCELALATAGQGDIEKALALSEQALALAGTIENPAPPYAYALWLRAQLEDRLGESPEKLRLRVEEAVRIYEDAGARYWAGQAKRWLEKLPAATQGGG
jgi:tetratricopeptide (TPR) repeat protein